MGVRTARAERGPGTALLRAVTTALLRAVTEQARRRHMRRLELTVMTHNRRALGLYLRRGLKVEGLRGAALGIDGEDVDEYYMGLLQ